MASLFDDDLPPASAADAPAARTPLAERMRPRTLDEIVGQSALLAPGRPLREAIDADVLQSLILWGPPGTGKTTLARVIADTIQGALRRLQRRDVRHQGDQGGDGRSRGDAPAPGPPDDPLRRRDPSLQQGAAGRLPAPRRSRRPGADRRHHREPVVRGQRRAPLPLQGVRAAAARRGGRGRYPAPRLARSRARARARDAAARRDARRRRGGRGRPLRQRRRPDRPERAGAGRRLCRPPRRAGGRRGPRRGTAREAGPALRQERRRALQP